MKSYFSTGCVALFALAFCSVAAAQGGSSSEVKKVVHCHEGNPDSFVPSKSTNSTAHDAMRPIYSRLIRNLRGSTRITGGLAEHWDISRDGTEIVFHLRKGVKWHSNQHFTPTRDFNADDVLFMIERQWKTDHPFHQVSGNRYPFFQSTGMNTLLKNVEKVDDHTIKITLNEPKTAFLFNFLLGFTAVQSHEYASKMLQQGRPEIIDQYPIGTGPFQFVGFEKDRVIRYKRFDDYWEGRAQIQELDFLIVPNPNDRWEKIKSNVCQVMTLPLPQQLDEMRKHPDVRVEQIPGVNVSYMAYNLTKPPFNDVRVRKALNMAVNKAEILDKVYLGNAINAVNLIPPTMWSHNDNVKDDPYDPQAAKQLLAEAGFPNGFTTELWAMSVARPHNPNPQLMAELISKDLAKIGVQAPVKVVDWSEYSRRLRNGEHQLGLQGWTGSHADPDYFFYNLLTCETASNGGANVSKFCNERYDELVMQARKIANPMLRIPLYEEAQQIFKDHAPWLTIAHTVQTVVFRNEIIDLRLNPFGGFTYYGVDIQRGAQRGRVRP